MKKIFQQQLLSQNVQMDASVNFQLNGNMLIVPCPWEDEKEVTNGERVHYRGGIEVDADGRTRVKRYKVGSKGPLKKYGLALTKALYQEEADEIMSYFKTRKEETIWK